MKLLALTYVSGKRVLVNQFAIRMINESNTQNYGLCSLIDLQGTTNQLLVIESLDEIQIQLDGGGDVSVSIKDK